MQFGLFVDKEMRKPLIVTRVVPKRDWIGWVQAEELPEITGNGDGVELVRVNISNIFL